LKIESYHGKLISLKGTVIKCTDVRPELIYGAFDCKKCGFLNDNIEQQFSFSYPKYCKNNNQKCDNRSAFRFNPEKSKFIDWQKIKLQENASEIPPGSMPRSVDVILKNKAVDTLKPGDRVILTGTLIVVPEANKLIKPGFPIYKEKQVIQKSRLDTKDKIKGLKDLGVKELSYKLAFITQSISKHESIQQQLSITFNNNLDNLFEALNDDQKSIFQQIKLDVNQSINFKKLSDLIAPHIYGHDNIKKGLLLQMINGIPKESKGTKLRGDINVCLIGDPGTSKSNFLKWINKFLPESVYSCGKTVSGAGLTASVNRDPDTGEFTIEAGALMLADNSICCIDEFDKIEDNELHAIHEAMEQQTISISKAGIHATLNARTSILAACNPKYGRYDKTKSLKYNVFMSDAIMSRFDLFYILTDDRNIDIDREIAKHILNVHCQIEEISEQLNNNEKYLSEVIKLAKKIKPQFTKESAEMLVNCYNQMRQNDLISHKKAYRVTVRQLESLVRLSEARARLDLDY